MRKYCRKTYDKDLICTESSAGNEAKYEKSFELSIN